MKITQRIVAEVRLSSYTRKCHFVPPPGELDNPSRRDCQLLYWQWISSYDAAFTEGASLSTTAVIVSSGLLCQERCSGDGPVSFFASAGMGAGWTRCTVQSMTPGSKEPGVTRYVRFVHPFHFTNVTRIDCRASSTCKRTR